MRLSQEQRKAIRGVVREIAGDDAMVLLFGSRVDDRQRGGDVDLLVQLPHDVDDAAWLAAQLAAGISRIMDGRKVDVLISAPNLAVFPIHEQARKTGVVL